MADATVAIGALTGAVFLLVTGNLALVWLYTRGEREWRAERSELLNRITADGPREFAVLQKAVAPKPERAEPLQYEPPLIGTT